MNILQLKVDIKAASKKLDNFFKRENFIQTSDDALRLKIVDNTMKHYYEKNFSAEKHHDYIAYINEIKNYLDRNFYRKETIEIKDILGLHEIIMNGLWTEKNTLKGVLRQVASVNRGKMLIKAPKITAFLSPKYVEEYTLNAIIDYNSHIKNENLSSIVNFVVDLWIYIHPFIDGNGKVCYILIDTLLWKHGYWPIFLSHPNNKILFRQLLQEYSDTKDLVKAKINFYEIILKIYSNYQIN